jgi:hypothetical protein
VPGTAAVSNCAQQPWFVRTVVSPGVATACNWQRQYPATDRVIRGSEYVRHCHLQVQLVIVQVDTVDTVGNAVTTLEGASAHYNSTNILKALYLSDRLCVLTNHLHRTELFLTS